MVAELEAPELDQQVSQAKAARDQTASTVALAESTVARWEALRKKDVVAQQELDEKRSAFAQAQANVAAADANVERLRQLEAFKRVVAPFAGIITRRNADVGDLIEGVLLHAFEGALEQSAAERVELLHHQVRGNLDDGHLQVEAEQTARRLQAE